MTFAEEKFRGNMKLAVITMVIAYLTSIMDYVLVGQVMGEESLKAFALVTPYVSIVTFTASMISVGTAFLIAREVGRGNRGEANKYFQQSLLLSVVCGILLGIAYWISKDMVFEQMRLSKELEEIMNPYFVYICFLPLWQILNTLLYGVIWNEGGDAFCIVSLIVQFSVNIIGSLVGMHFMGMSGVGLGTVVSYIAGSLVLVFYFGSRNNVFSWGFHLHWKSVIEVFQFSIRESLIYLYLAVLQLIMNRYLLVRFGGEAILVFSVIMNIESLYLTVFNAPANAVSVILNVFIGEKNYHGIEKSMKAARKASLIESIVVMLILFVFARGIPRVFGITTTSSILNAAFAIRIFALLSMVFPFIMLYSSYFLAIERVFLSIGMMTMQLLVMPILGSILFSVLLGMDGVWIGFVGGSVMMFLMDTMLLWRRNQNRTFPHLLKEEKLDSQLSYDVPISTESVMGLVYQVEQDLKSRGIEEKKIYQLMLRIEETEMLVVEKNRGHSGIIQCDIFLENPIRLILRDSGPMSDVTDQGQQIDSFRTYAAPMLLGNQEKNRYIMTWGNNRVIYKV